MPWSPPKHCPAGHPPYMGRSCPTCSAKRKAAADARRPTAHARGYDTKWQKEKSAWLAKPGNRLCACGCGRTANMVDHIIPPKGDMKLFWDRSNWQAMHSSCNTRKAIASEGGFGKAPKHPPGVQNFAAPLQDRCAPVKRNSLEIGDFFGTAQNLPEAKT